VGIGWGNLYNPVNGGGFSFGTALAMMLFDCVLYTLLGVYLNAVLPQEFGVPLPWYYPVTTKYWRPAHATAANAAAANAGGSRPWYTNVICYSLACERRQGDRRAAAGGDAASTSLLAGASSLVASADMESGGPHHHEALPFAAQGAVSRFDTIGVARGDNIEAPGMHATALAQEGRCVSIRGLRKAFNTPDGEKVAVAGLDMDMYEGEIFVLLGHNGEWWSSSCSIMIRELGHACAPSHSPTLL